MYMHMPHMPLYNEYSLYINPKAGKQYRFYWDKLKEEINANPVYSILLEESTDRRYEKHLILSVSFLTHGGKGEYVTNFVKLLVWKMAKLRFKGVKEVSATTSKICWICI